MIPSALRCLDHRPWPIPRRRWTMLQTWEDLLFLHWPISVESIRASVPSSLHIDTFEGQAWIALVPFRLRHLRLRGLPPIPGTSNFLELNVRTYVTRDAKPGVWFFSLDASRRLAVCCARAWYGLPYFLADLRLTRREDGIEFASRRSPSGSRAELTCNYRPGESLYGGKDSPLARWLTERYCLYSVDGRGRTLRGEIHHRPWSLRKADVSLAANTMLSAQGLPQPGMPPLAHFSATMEAVFWSPQGVERRWNARCAQVPIDAESWLGARRDGARADRRVERGAAQSDDDGAAPQPVSAVAHQNPTADGCGDHVAAGKAHSE